MPEPTRRGRPVRPILARIADNIDGMDFHMLSDLLKQKELPTQHWVWTGYLDVSGRSGLRRRGGTFERGKPAIEVDGKRQRVDRILFAHWVNNGEPQSPLIQVRTRSECGWHLCVNPSHKWLHAVMDQDHNTDEIEDLVGLILSQDSRDLTELEVKCEDFSRDEIAEALRRIGT